MKKLKTFEFMEEFNHEQVVYFYDKNTGLSATRFVIKSYNMLKVA